jgi:putative transposase
MDSLTEKRNARIDDYLHKASRKIINFCIENDIRTIVIGKNDGWKQSSKLSKRVNQHFVQIPFARLIGMIQYKAEEQGIAVILTEESYTSGTSFIDNEAPTRENYDKSRRVHREMFKSNSGTLINADLNGAYQIIKKVFPIEWDSGCVLHPIVVDVE